MTTLPSGHKFAIGIDPGVNTGVGVWDVDAKKLVRVESMMLVDALMFVQELHQSGNVAFVRFEDARLRTGYFGPNAKAKQQGAGSVKRDSKVWEEFLRSRAIPFEAISPQTKGAKVNAVVFKKLTGWDKASNEHGRDAAMMVFGWKQPVVKAQKALEVMA